MRIESLSRLRQPRCWSAVGPRRKKGKVANHLNIGGFYVSPFYQSYFVFLDLNCCAHFLALSGGGCGGWGLDSDRPAHSRAVNSQHQFGRRSASEQRHGSVQHRHRIPCALGQREWQLQHRQRIRFALGQQQSSQNTASGAFALSETKGDYNTASGAFALYVNSTGTSNTASGVQALYSNTTGNNNT